jgi:DNA-binding response OmpR family regulator
MSAMKILVVEDDEDSAALLAAILERQGWKVDTACSAEGARRALDRDRYEVLVTDLYLPDGLGVSLLDPPPSGLRAAVLVSGALDEAHRRKSRALGFQRCFAKPVSAPELVSAIRALASQTQTGERA